MTTTVDPYGTPVTIFNRSGTSLQMIDAPLGSTVALSAPSGVANFVVTVSGTAGATSVVQLPAGSQVGDVVKVFLINSSISVAPSAGEDIVGYTQPNQVLFSGPVGVEFLKYSDTSWAMGAFH